MNFQVECRCAGLPLSPGQSGCNPMVGRHKFPIFFHYIDSDGNFNGVADGDVLDEAYLDAKLNETDPKKRWYVFPEMFGLAAPPPENETEDRDGIPVPTGEEIKQPVTFHHSKEDANPALKAAYDSIKCEDLGVMYATYAGQLDGMNDGSGNLIGMHIQQGTMSAQYAEPVKGELQKMMISYLMDELENDANRDFIEAESIAYPVKSWFTNQPIQILPSEVVAESTTALVVIKLDGLYGQVGRKKPITGIVSADFSPDFGVTTAAVYNKTDDANVVIVAAEDGGEPGKYTLTYAVAQDSNDEVWIDIFKAGYLMGTLKVTVP